MCPGGAGWFKLLKVYHHTVWKSSYIKIEFCEYLGFVYEFHSEYNLSINLSRINSTIILICLLFILHIMYHTLLGSRLFVWKTRMVCKGLTADQGRWTAKSEVLASTMYNGYWTVLALKIITIKIITLRRLKIDNTMTILLYSSTT